MVDIETVADSVAESIVAEVPKEERQFEEAELYTYEGLSESWRVESPLMAVCMMVDVPKDAKGLKKIRVEKNGFLAAELFRSKFNKEKQDVHVVDSTMVAVKYETGEEAEWREVKSHIWKNRDGMMRRLNEDGSVQIFWENGNLAEQGVNRWYRSGVSKYLETDDLIMERDEDANITRFVDKKEGVEKLLENGEVRLRKVNGDRFVLSFEEKKA